LKTVIIPESFLHWVKDIPVGKALDRCDLPPIGFHCQHGAGFDRSAVDMNCTCTALACVAANMGPGQVQVFPNELDKQRSRFNIACY
jgi:hypothetical protein